MREVNATGFGLTFGVHSRIDETIERATDAQRRRQHIRQPQRHRRRGRRAAVRRPWPSRHRPRPAGRSMCGGCCRSAPPLSLEAWRMSCRARSASATPIECARRERSSAWRPIRRPAGPGRVVARDRQSRHPGDRRPAHCRRPVCRQPGRLAGAEPAPGRARRADRARAHGTLPSGMPGRRGFAQRQHRRGRRQCQPYDFGVGRGAGGLPVYGPYGPGLVFSMMHSRLLDADAGKLVRLASHSS